MLRFAFQEQRADAQPVAEEHNSISFSPYLSDPECWGNHHAAEGHICLLVAREFYRPEMEGRFEDSEDIELLRELVGMLIPNITIVGIESTNQTTFGSPRPRQSCWKHDSAMGGFRHLRD